MTSNLASTEIAEHGLQLRRESEDIAHKKAMDAASNDETNKSDDSDDNSNNEEKTSVKVLLFFYSILSGVCTLLIFKNKL